MTLTDSVRTKIRYKYERKAQSDLKPPSSIYPGEPLMRLIKGGKKAFESVAVNFVTSPRSFHQLSTPLMRIERAMEHNPVQVGERDYSLKIPNRYSYKRFRLDLFKRIEEKAHINIYEKYTPSVLLSALIVNAARKPKEPLLTIEEASNFISLVVEDFLFVLAKSAAFRKEYKVYLTESKNFEYEVWYELAQRLGVPLDKVSDILKYLLDELFEFVSESRRKRSWGDLDIEDNEIVLLVDRKKASKKVKLKF